MGINRILEKYKLAKTFEIELNVKKEVFINEFKKITVKGYYTPFLVMFDNIKTSKNKYIGEVNSNSFKIRERFNLENSRKNNFAIVKSEFHIKDNKLKVRTTIQGMEALPFILRTILFGIYLLMMLLIIIEILIPPIEADISYLFPPVFITVIVGFFTYLPYRIAKRNVVNKENEIYRIYQRIGTMYN